MNSKLIYISLWAVCLLATSCGTMQQPLLSDYVDPNIGTAHSRWFFYTPAAVPFGMAKVGPSTDAHYGNEQGWEAVGYDFRHESLEGFANFHEFQIGGVVLAPLTGALKTTPGSLENPDEGYRSRFDKDDEYATSGFYSVLLKDYGIKAELTATQRVGYHRYVFPESEDAHILFDIGNRQGESGAVKTAEVTLTEDGRIEGYVITTPEYVKKYQKGAEIAMYFSAVFDKEPTEWGAFNVDSIQPQEKQASGEGAGLYLTFDTEKAESVTVKVGLSYTSIVNARLNLETEAADLGFDAAKQQALSVWNDYLGRITVEGTNPDDKRKFYTGLFHALLGRGLASDVNGAYPMNNGDVGKIPLDASGKPTHNHYNTDAIWGAFWNLTQLWAMVYPEYYADWIQSQLLVYKDAGWLGDGIANSKYVSGVGTNFTGLAIAAAYNAGIRDFDVELAYEAARKNELAWENRLEGAGKMDVREFVQRGYSPYVDGLEFDTEEGSGFGASHTLEYAFSAHAVGQFAKALGKDGDYQNLSELAKGWRHLYDPETGFIRPRDAEGVFVSDFDPSQPWRGFQEGNAWQYTFYVPHDPAGLIGALGQEVFNSRLDSIFEVSRENIFGGGETIDAFAGLSGLYNHGNQPNLHISWLFNFSGKPWLTQKWTRVIGAEFYGVEPIHGYGFGQDEDQGQLGAWYVIASLGLFDVKGLTDAEPTIQFGSPVFDRATIKLGSGNTLIIETKENSADNVYVRSLSVDGNPYDKLWMNWKDLMKGGTLSFEMASEPNTAWETSERPPSVTP